MTVKDRSPIYCIGGCAVDREIRLIENVVLKSSNRARSATRLGGVARNVAAALAAKDHHCYLQSWYGSDSAGTYVLRELQVDRIDCRYMIELKDQPTAHYFAVLNPDGEVMMGLADMDLQSCHQHDFEQAAKTAWQTWQDNADIFLDTNLGQSLVSSLIESVRGTKMRLFIDPVSVAKSTYLPEDLNGCFLIKPDRYEAEALTGMKIMTMDHAKEAALKLYERGVQHVVMSLGADGCILCNEKINRHFSVKPLSGSNYISGAGDALLAEIIHYVRGGWSVDDALLASLDCVQQRLTA